MAPTPAVVFVRSRLTDRVEIAESSEPQQALFGSPPAAFCV
jgi:hypothetical protein